MSKFKDPHRKVKIDYAVLEELLSPLIMHDHWGELDIYSDKNYIYKIDYSLQIKARNILENS